MFTSVLVQGQRQRRRLYGVDRRDKAEVVARHLPGRTLHLPALTLVTRAALMRSLLPNRRQWLEMRKSRAMSFLAALGVDGPLKAAVDAGRSPLSCGDPKLPDGSRRRADLRRYPRHHFHLYCDPHVAQCPPFVAEVNTYNNTVIII